MEWTLFRERYKESLMDHIRRLRRTVAGRVVSAAIMARASGLKVSQYQFCECHGSASKGYVKRLLLISLPRMAIVKFLVTTFGGWWNIILLGADITPNGCGVYVRIV